MPGPTHLNSRAPDLSQATMLRFCSLETQFFVQVDSSDQWVYFAKAEGHRVVTYSHLCDLAVLSVLLKEPLKCLVINGIESL